MAWIESHQALGHHPKTLNLAEALKCGVPTAVGYLHLLWWWALDYAPHGRVERGSRVAAARACYWRGKPETFWTALTEAGFVDVIDETGTAHIHDWMEYAGRWVEKRRRDAERKRASRDEPSNGHPEYPAPDIRRTSNGTPTDGAGTVPNQPYLTNQPTGPDQHTPPSPPSDRPREGARTERCPECEMDVDQEGIGHGLSKLPGRVRNCSLDQRAPREWLERVEVGA